MHANTDRDGARRPRRQRAFLKSLAHSVNVARACRTAGIPRRTAYHWRDADPRFARQWDDALDDGIDLLEAELHRRAFEGVEKPVWHKGEQVGTVRHYSDALAMFLLKAHRPARYRDGYRPPDADRLPCAGAAAGAVRDDRAEDDDAGFDTETEETPGAPDVEMTAEAVLVDALVTAAAAPATATVTGVPAAATTAATVTVAGTAATAATATVAGAAGTEPTTGTAGAGGRPRLTAGGRCRMERELHRSRDAASGLLSDGGTGDRDGATVRTDREIGDVGQQREPRAQQDAAALPAQHPAAVDLQRGSEPPGPPQGERRGHPDGGARGRPRQLPGRRQGGRPFPRRPPRAARDPEGARRVLTAGAICVDAATAPPAEA